MTQLYCEIGKHTWHRDPQRGRPPLNCPTHQLAKPDIIVSVKKDIPVKPKSVIDSIPGLSELLKQDEYETLICEENGHEWQRKRARGKKPRFCPDHSHIGVVVLKVELTEKSREEKTNELLARISAQEERVKIAVDTNDIIYQEFMREGGINNNNDSPFKNWMKVNSRLLGEVTSLKARESELAAL